MLRSALALSLLALLPFAGCGGGSDDSGFSLTGAPNIIVTPNPIAFQALSIGESRTIEVTVENAADASGVLDLEPVRLLATPDLVLEQPLKFTLVQGDSTTLKLTYTPSDEEPDSGFLVFKWRGSVQEYQVPIVTAAQAGVLTLSPSPVKFGEVAAGTPKVIGVRAINAGSSPIDIGPLTVTGSADFRVVGAYAIGGGNCTGLTTENSLTTPFEIEPNGGFCIDVEYKPFNGGDDVGLLVVNPPFDPALPVQDPIVTASLQGSEVGPEIELNPVELNFGPLDVGEIKELTFTVENKGNADLVIAAVQKGESNFEIFDAISIVPEVAADAVVAPSSTTGLTVTVRFNPTKNYPLTYSTIGFLEVLSNDADEPIAYVKVSAQTKSAKLQVTPTPLIDFGIVAEATPGSTRSVTFTNVGTSDLEVTGLAIENNAANEFTIDEVVEDPMVIEPNSYRIVNLRYKNTGGAEGQVENGKLVFASTDQDPAAPTSVNLRATRAKKAYCAIKLEPVKVNFGTIGYGLEKKMTLNVTNIGSAPCSPFTVTVDDGPGTLFPGFPTGNCRIPNGDKSNAFFITNEPPAIKDLLQPGQSLPLQVKFAPTASIWSSISLDGLTEFKGIVQVVMLDYANPDLVNGLDYTVVAEPPGKFNEEVICNLEAKSGVANIAAIPGEVAFSKTTVGCFSKTQEIKVYNTGKAPIDLCGIELEGCGPEFKLKNVPAIPPCVNGVGGIKLTEASPITFGAVYVPQDTSKDGCSIVILSNDAETPGLTIPLEGEGTYDTTQTDEYTQLSGQQVDVLFIVDNSGSMSEEQSSLGSNISSFVAQAAQWQTDYHIGVVSTDVDETNTQAGWLQNDGGAQKRYFTNGTGTSGFASTVKSLGTNGSGTEQGLEAARMALSFPITAQPADPPKVCNADADCTKPQVCVPSVLNAGTKVCAGWNWEFLRPDAVLELVFVSDEEDGSSGNLSFYIDFFKSIKGFANTGLFHAHSIVGDEGSGCTSGSGDAAAGDRYIELSKQTNGKIKSICASNWADILKDIGTIAFGLKVQFFLSRPPIPETIVVKVAGSECTAGWEYQEDTNSILFDQNHPCMPQENEKIQIIYDVLCYSE